MNRNLKVLHKEDDNLIRAIEFLKGKPPERVGRKTTGLSPVDSDKAAGLLSETNQKPASPSRKRAFD